MQGTDDEESDEESDEEMLTGLEAKRKYPTFHSAGPCSKVVITVVNHVNVVSKKPTRSKLKILSPIICATEIRNCNTTLPCAKCMSTFLHSQDMYFYVYCTQFTRKHKALCPRVPDVAGLYAQKVCACKPR